MTQDRISNITSIFHMGNVTLIAAPIYGVVVTSLAYRITNLVTHTIALHLAISDLAHPRA